jgi:hypothetical protein
MKIDFDKLLAKEPGLTKKKLAQEMTNHGLFKSIRSGEMMIQYHQNGKAKGCDYALLKYLATRFKVKGSEIIQWN